MANNEAQEITTMIKVVEFSAMSISNGVMLAEPFGVNAPVDELKVSPIILAHSLNLSFADANLAFFANSNL